MTNERRSAKVLNSHSSSFIALEARIEILKMIHRAQASHIGSCFSVVDILVAIYSLPNSSASVGVLNEDRDICILSKGHAAAALYSVLAQFDLLTVDDLGSYCANGGRLGGHVTESHAEAVEFSTGSLGHGLPFGIGVAIAKKTKNRRGVVQVVMSDGELDEGTTWESLLIAAHLGLDNLKIIVDRNQLQSFGSTEDTIRLDPLDRKFEAFNWDVDEVNGHDHGELLGVIGRSTAKPHAVIANTIKGFGVSFMENNVAWHYRPPNESEFALALSELESQGTV